MELWGLERPQEMAGWRRVGRGRAVREGRARTTPPAPSPKASESSRGHRVQFPKRQGGATRCEKL